MSANRTKPGLMIYFELLPALEQLPPEEAGTLFIALLRYAQYGEVPDLEGQSRVLWPLMQPIIDRDSERYAERQQQSRWKAYCGRERRAGREPLCFEDWLEAQEAGEEAPQRAPACTCTPTTTTATATAPTSTTASSSTPATAPVSTTAPAATAAAAPASASRPGGTGAGPASHGLPTAFSTPEAEWDRKRNAAVRKLLDGGGAGGLSPSWPGEDPLGLPPANSPPHPRGPVLSG